MNSEAAMIVPSVPPVRKLDRISPTTYEAAVKCIARAAWLVAGDSRLLPSHPGALLGTAVHFVLERARFGEVKANTEEQRLLEAESLFDEKMGELFARSHPLLRAKFDSQQQLPFYNLYRARAAQMAAECGRTSGGQGMIGTDSKVAARTRTERQLTSKDGRVVGRPDVLDPSTATVIDTKTGRVSDPVKADGEVRQLRLYAFLAAENGVEIRRGVIERADRTRIEVPISASEAAEEGRLALGILEKYNQHVGKPFSDAAAPSPESCRFCPCMAICSAFWAQAKPDWAHQCGTHVEGEVESIEGDMLISIYLNVARGTGPSGSTVVTRLSRMWLTFDGSDLPKPGQTVRVTDAAHVEDTESPAVLRADRIATALWTLGETP
jgi:CRISPR/Cas system-associated exonuclease Cas4 (RecB family)